MIMSKKKNQKIRILTIPWTRNHKTRLPLTASTLYIISIIWTGLWSISIGYTPYESMYFKILAAFAVMCGLLLFGLATSRAIKVKNVFLIGVSTIFFALVGLGILYVTIFYFSLSLSPPSF